MDDMYDLDTIDVELDDYFKRKPIFQCRDEFLNILCEKDNNDDATDDLEGQCHNNAQTQIHNQPLDTKYESPHLLKLFLTNYAISKGYQIRFKKCDSIRLVVICGSAPEKCPFLVRGSWMGTERSFQAYLC
ncbi:unnamed protein product [Lactuca saligna]|uniref:Transposase MuDR plant domain-containing protein n=1 Tax=Lactuca saligna TaxID=75948 RepID=A0AA36A0A1_LACSI|nr:unnamed protein product [Lactuca saligna]